MPVKIKVRLLLGQVPFENLQVELCLGSEAVQGFELALDLGDLLIDAAVHLSLDFVKVDHINGGDKGQDQE